LVTHGRLTAGNTVLLQGTGGVSIFALQFAKLLGVRALITSSSDEKLERARKLGADGLINYRLKPEWSGAVRDLTGGEGVDLVVEVGGAGTLEQSLRSVRMGGTVCLIGNLAGLQANVSLALVFMQQVRLQGILVGDREGFEAMNRAIEQHQMKPVIDKTFSFADAPRAFEQMAAGGHFGKICIRV
jgi:NADPH:quinone reductase-like Zn-dependent oxidoreductase